MNSNFTNQTFLGAKPANIWLTMLLGATLFTLLSLLQKYLLGIYLFDLHGFILPVFIGCTSGFIVSLLFNRNRTHFTQILENQALAHKELVESEERFRLLAENARDVIFRWMLDEHRYQYVSPAVFTLTGHPPQAFLDNPQLLRELIIPEDQQVVEELGRQIESGDVTPHIEYRVTHKQGHVVLVNQRHAFGFDDDGKAISLEGICTDITSYREVRQEKLDVENQLYQSQKMEAIGRLAGGIAHDFNNLLTVINGYSEFLLEDSRNAGEKPFELLEIQKAGRKAADLTTQLLTFCRKQIATPRTIDPKVKIKESLRMLERMIGEDIRMEQSLDEDVPFINIDSIQLDQVLMNLVVNAKEAMTDGGTISIRLFRKEFDSFICPTCQVEINGELVLLEVSDTGCGMEKEVLERIFEPFFTTKDVHHGTGLGLSTVFGIVHQNLAHIQVESKPNEGTCFTIIFQGVDPEKAAKPALPQLESPQLRGDETILVVEDESLVRSLTFTVLQQHGYEVLIASDGNEAKEIYQTHSQNIDLMLTDVIMPGINGVELAEDLTRIKPDLKVIFMSGYVDNKLDLSGISASPHAFLKKPFGSEALARIVRQVLDEIPH